MSRLKRITNKIFGSTASTTGSADTGAEIGQFGSAKAGTYNATGDVATIQALPAYEQGWIGAVIPNQQYPTLPEMTGVNKVLSYQTGYLFQEGIPEWDADTTYYKNSIVKYAEVITTQTITASIGASTGITSASVNKDTFVNQISVDGNYIFTYNGTSWLYNKIITDLSLYGITFEGAASANDTITITLTTTQTAQQASAYISLINDNIDNNPLTDVDSWTVWEFGDYANKSLTNLSSVGQAKLDFCFDSINRLYDGVDLTTKFASEIANYSDAWAWIKNRITNGNYTGINVGDYIPFTLSAGTAGDYTIAAQSMKAQIAGIDTYKNCCDTEVGHHIDFISKELIDTPIKWNPTDNNNGTSANNEPWLASAIYAVLNGVNNYSTSAYGSQAHGAKASGKGIYQLLPQALRNQIIQKRNIIDTRYSTSAYLTYSTNWNWKDMGYLWLPNEIEVYGTQIRSNLGYGQGYWNPEANIGVAYPLFLGQGRNRVKRKSNNGRCTWWLSSATAHTSANVCNVHSYGYAGSHVAASAAIFCPVCFRIG